jgi:hypothetical protein
MSSNDHLLLVGGKSGSGKSTSLMDYKDDEGVLYLNAENGKKLPFKAKFVQKVLTDPLQIHQAFDWAETNPAIHTIVIDTWTFLNEMYESLYIIGAADGRAAWGAFAQFVKKLMQQYVAASTKRVVFLAHTADKYNEGEMLMESAVPVKGAMKNQGLEAFFSVVVTCRKMKIKDLKDYLCPENKLLVVTPQEEALGFKHVFQTSITKETTSDRIRGPIGMWLPCETYIDNSVKKVMDRLDQYYAD